MPGYSGATEMVLWAPIHCQPHSNNCVHANGEKHGRKARRALYHQYNLSKSEYFRNSTHCARISNRTVIGYRHFALSCQRRGVAVFASQFGDLCSQNGNVRIWYTPIILDNHPWSGTISPGVRVRMQHACLHTCRFLKFVVECLDLPLNCI